MPRTRELRALLAVAAAALACATIEESERYHPPILPDARYDALFPYYIELCAVSQIRANFAPHGGSGGHAVMYLKGACRDPQAAYPTLEVCGDGWDPLDPEAGTGVSVNKVLRNVNWLATPGRRLFYAGNVSPDEVLDRNRAIAAIYAARDAGVFDGVEIHGEYLPPEDDEQALLYLAAAQTLGTDFALSFGRSSYCARLPLARPELEAVIGYLNGLNREYALGEADYEWSGYEDNCSHTLRNALAAAGVWAPKSVRAYGLRQLANLSVPANEFANLALLSMKFPIDDFDHIYRDPVLRDSLTQRGWLPTGHGALMIHIPVHQKNELYDTKARLFVLQSPIWRDKSHRVNELYDDPRYTNLDANLRHYRGIYESILEDRPEDARAPAQGREDELRARYYAYIEAQLADVTAKLQRLSEIGPQTRSR